MRYITPETLGNIHDFMVKKAQHIIDQGGQIEPVILMLTVAEEGAVDDWAITGNIEQGTIDAIYSSSERVNPQVLVGQLVGTMLRDGVVEGYKPDVIVHAIEQEYATQELGIARAVGLTLYTEAGTNLTLLPLQVEGRVRSLPHVPFDFEKSTQLTWPGQAPAPATKH